MPRLQLSDASEIEFPMTKVAEFHSAWDAAEKDGDVERVLDTLADELAPSSPSTSPSSRPPLIAELRQTLRHLRPVSKEVFAERIKQCLDCEHSRQLAVGDDNRRRIVQCGQCGCVMNIKARMLSGACPLGKFK